MPAKGVHRIDEWELTVTHLCFTAQCRNLFTVILQEQRVLLSFSDRNENICFSLMLVIFTLPHNSLGGLKGVHSNSMCNVRDLGQMRQGV